MAQLDRHNKAEKKEDLVEKLVFVNRVAKTVKGGRTMSFAALVVVGDQKGRIGFGSGKAAEVPEAIVKATNEAKKNMVRIPLREGRTLHHDITGRFGAGKVVLRSAPAGTGVIAGGPMRAVFEVLGVQDVVAKSLGSNNPYNMIPPIVPVASLLLVAHCMASAYTLSSTTGPHAERLLRLVNVLANWCASSRTPCWRLIQAHPWLSWATSTTTLWTRASPSRSAPSVNRARQVPTTFTILGGTRS